MHTKDYFSGYSLAVMLVLSLASSLWWPSMAVVAGLFAWLAALKLFLRVQLVQKIQIVLMLSLGGLGLLYSWAQGGSLNWLIKALTNNLSLIAMLLAVSFLRLVTVNQLVSNEQLPQGKKALWQTLFGVHFLGAVINFSAVVIVADRLAAAKPLTPLQALLVSRGFALAAHWSPFFASMGVVLISAPGASLWHLMPMGLMMALIALVIAGWNLINSPEARVTSAYPMHRKSLFLPVVLAVSVFIWHLANPELPVLTLVSLTALGISLLLLLWRDKLKALFKVQQHLVQALPSMAGETLLFLSAGVLAAGLGAVLNVTEFSVHLSTFGPWEAWLLLIGMVSVSVLGIHPVITLAAVGGFLAPWVENINLLGLVFLTTWSLGLSLSPLSGTHLAIDGRYGIPAYKFTRWNLGYVVVLLSLQLPALYLYSFFLGV